MDQPKDQPKDQTAPTGKERRTRSGGGQQRTSKLVFVNYQDPTQDYKKDAHLKVIAKHATVNQERDKLVSTEQPPVLPPVPASKPTATSCAVGCATSLQKTMQAAQEGKENDADSTTVDAFADCYGRFKTWASNIGALKSGPKSLDVRLSNAPRILERVIGILTGLQTNLDDLYRIVALDGKLDTTDLVSMSDSESGLDSDLGTDTEDDEEESTEQLLIKSANDSISTLMRISIIVQKATTKTQFARSAKLLPMDSFWDVRYVREKYPKTDGTHEWLSKRLGEAITRRRQHFHYRETHKAKFAEKPTNDTKTEYTAPTLLAGDIELERNGDDDEILRTDAAASDTTFNTTATMAESALKVPSIPPEGRDGEPFNCPYCHNLTQVKSRAEWKKHVYRDLRPYVCTHMACSKTLELFEMRHEWFEHELSHMQQRTCTVCGTQVQDTEKLISHLEQDHGLSNDNPRTSTILESAPRSFSKTLELRCPFCTDFQHTSNGDTDATRILKLYRKHVGRHMEQLALFALPSLEPDEPVNSDEDIDSNESVAESDQETAKAAQPTDGNAEATWGMTDPAHFSETKRFLETAQQSKDATPIIGVEDQSFAFPELRSTVLRLTAEFGAEAKETKAAARRLDVALQALTMAQSQIKPTTAFGWVTDLASRAVQTLEAPPELAGVIRNVFLTVCLQMQSTQQSSIQNELTPADSAPAQNDAGTLLERISENKYPVAADKKSDVDSKTEGASATKSSKVQSCRCPDPSCEDLIFTNFEEIYRHRYSYHQDMKKAKLLCPDVSCARHNGLPFPTLIDFVEHIGFVHRETGSSKEDYMTELYRESAETGNTPTESLHTVDVEPDEGALISFHDAVGRKFNFPWRICKTWKGMEALIGQAFTGIDVLEDQVRQGHYDLTGPDGEIILPQVWEQHIRPAFTVSMQMWPLAGDERDALNAALQEYRSRSRPAPPDRLDEQEDISSDSHEDRGFDETLDEVRDELTFLRRLRPRMNSPSSDTREESEEVALDTTNEPEQDLGESKVTVDAINVPANARWTKVVRRMFSPQALEDADEKFEERDELQVLAHRTAELRSDPARPVTPELARLRAKDAADEDADANPSFDKEELGNSPLQAAKRAERLSSPRRQHDTEFLSGDMRHTSTSLEAAPDKAVNPGDSSGDSEIQAETGMEAEEFRKVVADAVSASTTGVDLSETQRKALEKEVVNAVFTSMNQRNRSIANNDTSKVSPDRVEDQQAATADITAEAVRYFGRRALPDQSPGIDAEESVKRQWVSSAARDNPVDVPDSELQARVNRLESLVARLSGLPTASEDEQSALGGLVTDVGNQPAASENQESAPENRLRRLEKLVADLSKTSAAPSSSQAPFGSQARAGPGNSDERPVDQATLETNQKVVDFLEKNNPSRVSDRLLSRRSLDEFKPARQPLDDERISAIRKIPQSLALRPEPHFSPTQESSNEESFNTNNDEKRGIAKAGLGAAALAKLYEDRIQQRTTNVQEHNKQGADYESQGVSRRPTYPKIRVSDIETETLEYYNLKWEIDRGNSEFIVILQELTKHETDILFEHTRRLRNKTLSNTYRTQKGSEPMRNDEARPPKDITDPEFEDPDISDARDQTHELSSQGLRTTHKCDLCGETFARAHNLKSHMLTHRDPNPVDKPTKSLSEGGGNPIEEDQMICSNCKRKESSRWRHDPDGNTLCNACGIYLQQYGVSRPLQPHMERVKTRRPNQQSAPAKVDNEVMLAIEERERNRRPLTWTCSRCGFANANRRKECFNCQYPGNLGAGIPEGEPIGAFAGTTRRGRDTTGPTQYANTPQSTDAKTNVPAERSGSSQDEPTRVIRVGEEIQVVGARDLKKRDGRVITTSDARGRERIYRAASHQATGMSSPPASTVPQLNEETTTRDQKPVIVVSDRRRRERSYNPSATRFPVVAEPAASSTVLEATDRSPVVIVSDSRGKERAYRTPPASSRVRDVPSRLFSRSSASPPTQKGDPAQAASSSAKKQTAKDQGEDMDEDDYFDFTMG